MITDSKFSGLVTKKFNEFFLVDLKYKENFGNIERFLCKVRKSINFKDQFIYVGDEVVIENIDLKSKRAVITSLKKRKNLLVRPSVANISNIYIIFSVVEPELNLSQVNRFLISAESMGVEVSLVLTKCDLISDKRRSFLIDKFEKWGYQAITLNLEKSNNFNKLLAELKEKECSIFMGPSGVGKTTLLNMIIPGLQNSTASVSNKIKRGKNTTRNVELFSIANQSYIVDTPGFNMQPLEVDIRVLPNLYSEIYKQVIDEEIKCKFRNCLHLNDEGCNLNKSFERYSFYKEMIESSKSHYCQNQED
ncbi:Ribosome small subunit-stimulated GTPase EngC [Prochlorococcus marinus str. MIT 9201]|uniref:Small ribosomal subunit biogenesis GTPase RsgA n=1 Tax=Prochlorococcus marinus str. MIT 9201 TaxID=93057 RepID=A0A0A2A2N0_PROMR|nr:ribosome small subunit-dependent GTPase A [Prochlorococcus marinus]KGF94774.1 Ribosome small subunit-stimulated GTPase EngC [Prochlorococcus marinus str. MIT 9201]